MSLAKARRGKPWHNFASPGRQQFAHQRQAFRSCRRFARLPVQHGGVEGGDPKRIWHLVAIPVIGPFVFLLSSLAHRMREIALEVAEEREGSLRTPFLAHEQHGDHGRKKRHCESGLDFLPGCQRLETITKRAVADLVVVLQEVDEGRGRKLAAGLAARLVAPECRGFALVDKA